MTFPEMHRSISDLSRLFSRCLRCGCWFCSRCDRVHSVGHDDLENVRCPHCKHLDTSKWYAPVLEGLK